MELFCIVKLGVLDGMGDAEFMREAIAVGRDVEGHTGDNPAVGCVVVHAGRIVARGGTQPPGSCHAEAWAIRAAEEAGVPIAECDLYVTLEPCSFHGRTPACSKLITQKRPRRVVVGSRDPHPRVRGSGIDELRAAGIDVVEGVLADEVRAALRDWFARWPDGNNGPEAG
jgi:diaminohydroxyphosphoribosylaminopyrimidine deaminase/5-amino-6-(5-phosphoribosylamino)uracil reductase